MNDGKYTGYNLNEVQAVEIYQYCQRSSEEQALLAIFDHLMAAEEILEPMPSIWKLTKGKNLRCLLDRLYLDAGRIGSDGRGFVSGCFYRICGEV